MPTTITRDYLCWRRIQTTNLVRRTITDIFDLAGVFKMIFYPQERIAIFIDGANLYSAARSLAFDIDYKRLLDLFRSKGRLIRAFYYTALIEDQEYSPIRPLVDWLDYNGYSMVTKPTKEFTDPMGRRRIKGNMEDIELAIDMLEMAGCIDHADSVLRRWRFPPARRSGAAARGASVGGVHHPLDAADGLRRFAPGQLASSGAAGEHGADHPMGGPSSRARSGREAAPPSRSRPNDPNRRA